MPQDTEQWISVEWNMDKQRYLITHRTKKVVGVGKGESSDELSPYLQACAMAKTIAQKTGIPLGADIADYLEVMTGE